MRIYLAGPWVHREQVGELSKLILEKGYEISHPWWSEDTESLEICAKKDYLALKYSDVLIVWNSAVSEGKAVEQGLALAWNIPIIVVTPGETPTTNVFHSLPNIKHFTTLEQALNHIDDLC